MAVITRITTQKKSRKRFNIFLDRGNGEEFGFGAGEDVLVTFALGKGKEIDEDELKSIIFEDEVKTAFNLAVNFLSYRMHSVKEVKDYLQKKEMNPEVTPRVLERLAHHTYIDDAEFAKTFVRSRKRASSKGPAFIRQELIQKGISEDHIIKALEEYPFDEQVGTAAVFASKQAKQQKKKSNAELKQNIMRILMGKGFSSDVIQTALNEATLKKGEDEEWQALIGQADKAQRKYQKYEGWEYERRMKQHLYGKGFPVALIDRYLENSKDT